MQLAKAVANAAAALVLKAKNVAQKTEDSVLQAQVILAATQCALSTSQLVACTKVSGTNPRPTGFGTRSPGFSPLWRLGTVVIWAMGCWVENRICMVAAAWALSSPAGRGSHHQLPSVPGAADRGRQVGG